MAKKVFLQDLDEKLLPITRGELVLDSSGKEAFHSEEFLASTTLPGLMSTEDKIRLSLLSSIPVIEGNESDEYGHWTGLSSDITEYYDGLTIIYIPFVAGTVKNIYLKLNQLEEKKVNILENNYETSTVGEYSILVLVFKNDSWNTTDFNDTWGIPNHVWICENINTTKIIARGTYALTAPSYVPIIFPSNNTQLDTISIRFMGTNQTYYPIYINGSISGARNSGIPRGFYLAYFDGEKVYLNTNGIIPGVIEKAKLAETVEWNIVTEGDTNPDLDIFSTTVDNASYLTIHNLGSAERAPETYKPQAVTAWINQDGMPTQSAYSGLNITSSDPTILTSWLLCSNASELNYGARLWFRTGIANDWQSWLQVAFTNDLLTHGMGIILSASDDVNSLSTGIYSVESEDTAAKIVNAPVDDSGFKLFTLAGYQSPTSYGSQLAFSKDNFYWRLLGQNNLNCSAWYSWIKYQKGESVGSPVTPMYIDDDGVPRGINCLIEKSVPANAQFTDTRCTSLNIPIKPEAETISDESEVVGVLKADSISASGDGTYLSGNLNWVNVPTENFVKKTFKVKQEPVEDPTADGVSTTFIDTISLDENGKITVTKKTIQSGSGGGESSGTNVGEGILTIKVNGSETQFSANSTENKTVTINTLQSIPIASETDLGGIKLGYTESGTNLAVKLDNEKAHVTLSKNAIVSALGFEPGTGSGGGSITSITPGIGLTGTNDDSAITSSGTINLKQADSSELGGIKIGYTQNDKNYPVVLDTDNKAYVNVPYPDAKYCNDAVLKTADFPAYNSTEIAAIDASLTNDVNIENYFKALCKYVYAKYKTEQASNSAITLLGQARPGSTGTLLMSMYTNHPCTNDPTMPKYVSGNFVNLDGQSFIFTNYDDLWTWKQLGSGTVTSITPGTGLTRTDDTGNTQVDTAVTTSGTINLKLASTNELGGIKVGYITDLGAKNYQVLVDESGNAYVNVPWQSGASVDTKNTAGATNSEEELFIIGSTEQSDNPQTYSNVNIKISENAIKASGGFYQESDERLKDFHDDILVDLEQLSNLPKKKFTWKSDDRKKINIGTSAQELQKLYPELVKEDSNGTLSVSYDKLSIIALRAIDELYVLVKTLQEENNQLKELIRNNIK